MIRTQIVKHVKSIIARRFFEHQHDFSFISASKAADCSVSRGVAFIGGPIE
jgi:hypothetical protein